MKRESREGGGEKARRHEMIREIVSSRAVETQEELANHLRNARIKATQATVSRDIKEIMLVKTPTEGGHYRYALPEEKKRTEDRLTRLFAEAVTRVEENGAIVVIRTLPGMANAVASAVDRGRWPEILGTVAGDDTIFAAVKPLAAAPDVARRMREMTGK